MKRTLLAPLLVVMVIGSANATMPTDADVAASGLTTTTSESYIDNGMLGGLSGADIATPTERCIDANCMTTSPFSDSSAQ